MPGKGVPGRIAAMATVMKRIQDHLTINIVDHPESIFVRWNLPIAFRDEPAPDRDREAAARASKN